MADTVTQFSRPQTLIARLATAGVLLIALTPSLVGQRGPRDLSAQDQPQLPSMSIDESAGTIRFSMAKSMKLLNFIKWAQSVTGKRFTFDPAEFGRGEVHFLGEFRVDRERFQEEFFSFFQTMLYIKGFAIVPRGEGDQEILEIVMMTGMRGREVSNSARYVAPEELNQYRYQTGVPILTTVRLKHINVQLANNALRPFFASTGGANAGGSVQIGNVGNQSAMLLQGFGPQVYAAVQLLKLVDEPTEPTGEAAAQGEDQEERPNRVMQVVVLEHADAATIEQALNGAGQAKHESQATDEPDDHGDKMEFSMKTQDGMELVDFIKWAQSVTGKRFTFNSAELASGATDGSKVHFLGTVRVDRDRYQEEFFSFFQTMLYIKGFALVPRGEGDLELFEIVMMRGTRGREVSNGARYVTPDKLSRYRHQTGVPVLTTVKLHNINAQLANNALRPFFASTGGSHGGGSVQIGNVGNKSSLLLQGFGPQVYAAAQLLRLVDQPSEHDAVVAKAMANTEHNAVVVSGPKKQVQRALEMIAELDVPNAKPGKAAGFGFTNFGQAKFVDTDDDGLPDTRLPNFEKPLRSPASKKPKRKKGKSVIF